MMINPAMWLKHHPPVHLIPLLITGIVLAAGKVIAADEFPMQATSVAPGVYAIITPSRDIPGPENRGWNSNSAFVVTNEGVLLFDTGSSSAIGEAIKKLIAGVTEQPVRWIVNSHAHGDHWLGNGAFRDTVDAIYASEQTTDTIAANGQLWVDRFQQMTEGATGRSEIAVPDTLVSGQTELMLGGVQISLFLSGNSHSPGDVLMWLPGQKVLVSGDVVYSDRMPSTLESDLTRWISLLDEIVAMQPKVVIPGHGSVTDLEGVMRLRDLLQAYWTAVEQGYDAGKTDYEMVPDVITALSAYASYYPGLAEKIQRDISGVYLQVEAASLR